MCRLLPSLQTLQDRSLPATVRCHHLFTACFEACSIALLYPLGRSDSILHSRGTSGEPSLLTVAIHTPTIQLQHEHGIAAYTVVYFAPQGGHNSSDRFARIAKPSSCGALAVSSQPSSSSSRFHILDSCLSTRTKKECGADLLRSSGCAYLILSCIPS